VDPDRCYADYQSLFRGEAARPDGIQAVSVATPNNTHYAICRAALEAGLHVVCEKPLCFSSEEADELVALSQRRRKIIGVTYGYAGHQLILQARQMIADGLLGDIRIVNMQFAHGFHAQPVEQECQYPLAGRSPLRRPQLCAGRPGHPSAVSGRNHGPAAEDHPADVRQTKLRQKPRAAGR
jgi:predicted dehydrogenase